MCKYARRADSDSLHGCPCATKRNGCSSARIERVANPLDATLRLDQKRVESTGVFLTAARKIGIRSGGQAAALGGADALDGPTVRSARARAHLDEYQRLALTRDEIDLAEAAVPIALDDLQAAGTQEFGRARFRLTPDLIQWRTEIGIGRPSAN